MHTTMHESQKGALAIWPLSAIFISVLHVESEDVDRFVRYMKELTGVVNDDILDTFLIEMGFQGHSPPVTMALEIAAALHDE